MFARAALFAHIQRTLFNVETIEPSGRNSVLQPVSLSGAESGRAVLQQDQALARGNPLRQARV
jgi:hypothetical protein